MRKTNSKEVKNEVRQYIIDSFFPDDYRELEQVNGENFEDVATAILSTFYAEKKHDCYFRAGRCSLFDLFRDWCAGLPEIIGGCWYWNESAVDLVGKWLGETEEEKARYDISDAERLIDTLIYRELTKAARPTWKGGEYYDN